MIVTVNFPLLCLILLTRVLPISGSNCPPDAVDYQAGRLCYWENRQTLRSDDAHSRCALQGGGLADFPDAAAEAFVTQELGIQSYTYGGCRNNRCDTWYVGYRDNVTDGVYTTWTGQPATYMSTNIALNGGTSEDCVIVWKRTPTQLHWQDRRCSSPRYSICYKHYTLPDVRTSGHWHSVYVGILQNHVMHHVTARSLVRCAQSCQEQIGCASFTFSRERDLCQLNDVTPGAYPLDLVTESACKTYQIT